MRNISAFNLHQYCSWERLSCNWHTGVRNVNYGFSSDCNLTENTTRVQTADLSLMYLIRPVAPLNEMCTVCLVLYVGCALKQAYLCGWAVWKGYCLTVLKCLKWGILSVPQQTQRKQVLSVHEVLIQLNFWGIFQKYLLLSRFLLSSQMLASQLLWMQITSSLQVQNFKHSDWTLQKWNLEVWLDLSHQRFTCTGLFVLWNGYFLTAGYVLH